MRGIQQIGKGIRVANDRYITRIPFKDGTTALMQVNYKQQKYDCVVLSKGRIIGASGYKGSHLVEELGAFAEKIAKNVEGPLSNITNLIGSINKKAIIK